MASDVPQEWLAAAERACDRDDVAGDYEIIPLTIRAIAPLIRAAAFEEAAEAVGKVYITIEAEPIMHNAHALLRRMAATEREKASK